MPQHTTPAHIRLILVASLAVLLAGCRDREPLSPSEPAVQFIPHELGAYVIDVPLIEGYVVEPVDDTEIALIPLDAHNDSTRDLESKLAYGIVIGVAPNPRNLKLYDYFSQPGRLRYFDNAVTLTNIKRSDGKTLVLAADVPGVVSTYAGLIAFEDVILIITDVNQQHIKDGMFRSVAETVRLRQTAQH